MSIKGLRNPSRNASSALMGYALVGSPLCPTDLVARVNPYAGYCTINATGVDSISLLTGLGSFGGTFTIVVQDVNPFDSPEIVVGKGRFHGKMDFSPAILMSIPLGSVDGFLTYDNGRRKVPFKGTFRLPTAAIADSRLAGYCRVPEQPTPDWCLTPFYLLDDYSTVDVRPDERALGYPTVRFEITF
jgi:hypothetical protein